MKRTILFFGFLFIVSISTVNAQKYGLGNSDPSVFTKFRIPETNLSKIWFNTNLYLNTEKDDYRYLQPWDTRNTNLYNSKFTYDITPNYYLLRESEENYFLLNTSLSGQYSKLHSEYTPQYGELSRDYNANLSLIITYNRYISQSDIFYSLGSDIKIKINDSRWEYIGDQTDKYYSGDKNQNYSFSIGMGIGKQRNITPVVSAIRFQERLKQLNLLSNDLSEKTIEDLAQQFYKDIYYSTIYDRPDKYFWGDIEKTLLQEGVTIKGLNMYADNYLRESVNEVRFLRSEALMAGLNLRPQYGYEYYTRYPTSARFLALGEVYFIYSHQMNLNSQLNIKMSADGGPNIFKHPDVVQEYMFSGNAGYDYELTDRLAASLHNEFNIQFINSKKQSKDLVNNMEFTLRYFIEDNLSLNANYLWIYRVNKYPDYENVTNNIHTVNIGFSYYFDKGFIM